MSMDLMTKMERYDQDIAKLCLMDDDFARIALNDARCLELILEIVFEESFLQLIKFQLQNYIKNFDGRDVCADFYLLDSCHRHIILEIQNDDAGASMKRARYLGSMLDIMVSEPGDDWIKMPELYVVFITRNDTLHKQLPIYHIEHVISESHQKVDMEISYLYLHTQNKEDTALGRLMHDMTVTDPDEMYYEVLRERVEYFKKGNGKAKMCEIMREIEERGKAEGKAEGEMQKAIEIAVNMLKTLNLSYEAIQKCTGLSLEKIEFIDLSINT